MRTELTAWCPPPEYSSYPCHAHPSRCRPRGLAGWEAAASGPWRASCHRCPDYQQIRDHWVYCLSSASV